MPSFNSYEKYRYFDKNAFLSFWQSAVFGSNDPDKLDPLKKRSETDKLRDRIKKLWMSFNENREDFRRKYSDTKKFINAYISSFYLPNIQRIYSILMQKQNQKEIVSSFENAGEEFVIMDFGAGPMSATFGLLLVLDHSGVDLRSKKIIFITVERSSNMISTGLDMIRAGFPSGPEFLHENFTSPLKAERKCDIILCANVFNEIPEQHRLSNLEDLLSLSRGLMLITEPGQEVHSKALSSLRNDLISGAGYTFSIVSPCTHSGLCPLSSECDRQDWCWFSSPWRVPDQAAFVDRITGLDHRQLNFSYLFIKMSARSTAENKFRIISDLIIPVRKGNRFRFDNWMRNNIIEGDPAFLTRVSDMDVGKMLLCGPDGKLCSIIGSKNIFAGLKRGDTVSFIPQNSCLCKER
ncbi:MAG: small ribosomal subunit Rsm22 family protein [Candidatus Delongbacteria bacterium]|nr:small ribosomal subunit Rsm22 family protein [Candidatus Delongbacteria bacterium]